MLVKVCGITNVDDATMVVHAGVDWIGLNFWPNSKRYVDLALASCIADAARRVSTSVVVAGVFVNPTSREIQGATDACTLDVIQLHGDESAAFAQSMGQTCMKAMPLKLAADLETFSGYSCPFMLIDAATHERGGSGALANWELAKKATRRHPKTFLAGGLTPDNVAEGIRAVRPYGVDVASGVEKRPGVKDEDKVRRFVSAVRENS